MVLRTRPAQAIKINGWVLSIRAMGAAGRQGRLRHRSLIITLYIDFSVDYAMRTVFSTLAVHVCARRWLGEVTAGAVEVDCLSPAVRSLDGSEEIVALFSVTILLVDTKRGRWAVSHMRGNGTWPGRLGVHDGAIAIAMQTSGYGRMVGYRGQALVDGYIDG